MATPDIKFDKRLKRAITERGLRILLKRAIADGSITEWAQDHDITVQATSAFLTKAQTAGKQIPEILGYRPQVVYLPLDEEPIYNPSPRKRR